MRHGRNRSRTTAALLLVLALVLAACSGASETAEDAAPDATGDVGADTAATEDAGTDGGAPTEEGTAAADGASGDAADFYSENSELQLIGGHDAGSGFDFYMRAVARAIERVSDHSVTVQNIPGGGGLIGDNQLFESEPDGLTFGLLNYPGHVFAQLTGTDAVRFDFAEWEWLGRVASGPPVILVAADGPYETAEDLFTTEEPVRFGIEGAGSDAFYGAALASETFGFPGELITGYEGTSDILTAILRGEVDATFLSYGSALQGIENGDMRALMIFSDEQPEELPDVPLATDFADSPEAEAILSAFGNIYDLERVFVAPPGTPEDRVAYLRDLLMEAFQEEQFVQEIEDAGRVLDPMAGAEVEEASAAVAEQAATLQSLLEAAN